MNMKVNGVARKIMRELAGAELSPTRDVAAGAGVSYSYAHNTLRILYQLQLVEREVQHDAAMNEGEDQVYWYLSPWGLSLLVQLGEVVPE